MEKILPNAHLAYIDDRKLTEYCLNPEHAVGKNKAKVFKSALNLIQDNYVILKEAILEAVLETKAQVSSTDQYGTRYSTDFQMENEDKLATVRATWICETSADAVPRLTSCYIVT